MRITRENILISIASFFIGVGICFVSQFYSFFSLNCEIGFFDLVEFAVTLLVGLWIAISIHRKNESTKFEKQLFFEAINIAKKNNDEIFKILDENVPDQKYSHVFKALNQSIKDIEDICEICDISQSKKVDVLKKIALKNKKYITDGKIESLSEAELKLKEFNKSLMELMVNINRK